VQLCQGLEVVGLVEGLVKGMVVLMWKGGGGVVARGDGLLMGSEEDTNLKRIELLVLA